MWPCSSGFPFVPITLVATAVLLAGCGGNDGPEVATSPTSTLAFPSDAVSSSADGPTIPDGSWSRTIKTPELAALGIELTPAELDFAPDGTLQDVYKFSGDNWTQFANYDGGVLAPGDGGSSTYDAKGNWVTTNSAGDTYTYAWTVDGDRLTLKLIGHDSSDSPEEVAIVRLMTEGNYVRQ